MRLFLALMVGALSGVLAECQAPPNVVLVGWDGAQREHVYQMLATDQLPNLAALIAEGRLVDVDVTTGATDSKGGWVQILTGYLPAKTGTYSNLDYCPLPVGYSLFERLESHFGPANIITAALLAKNHHVGGGPARYLDFEEWAAIERRRGNPVPEKPEVGLRVRGGGLIIYDRSDYKVAFAPEPYFFTKKHMDLFRNALGPGNERIGRLALDLLEQHHGRHFCFFFHFEEPDRAGHRYGENSAGYSDAIRDDDRWLGLIVGKLKALGIYDRTLVYVTSDHGFDEGRNTHLHAPTIFLATNDRQVRHSGDRVDIAPTILERVGVDVSRLTPPLDGASLSRAARTRRLVTWTWEKGGFFNTGVNPKIGDAMKTQFRFRVRYVSTNGDPPTVAQCILERLEGSGWTQYATVPMHLEYGDPPTGAVYTCLSRLPNEIFRHRFDFRANNGMVVGDPLTYQPGPRVRGVPHLWWSGQDGWREDGVEPSVGRAGAKFMFRVRYADSEGDPPRISQLQLRRDGQSYAVRTMVAYPAKDYRAGEIFRTCIALTEPGAYEYRFRFVDDDGDAVGEPCRWHSGPTVLPPGTAATVTSLTAVPTQLGAQILFTLGLASRIDVSVLNVAGRHVRRLISDAELEAGSHLLLWDGKDETGLPVPAGRYLVRLTARGPSGSQGRKMAVVSFRR